MIKRIFELEDYQEIISNTNYPFTYRMEYSIDCLDT